MRVESYILRHRTVPFREIEVVPRYGHLTCTCPRFQACTRNDGVPRCRRAAVRDCCRGHCSGCYHPYTSEARGRGRLGCAPGGLHQQSGTPTGSKNIVLLAIVCVRYHPWTLDTSRQTCLFSKSSSSTLIQLLFASFCCLCPRSTSSLSSLDSCIATRS